jgi:hypothetical protein
MERDEILKKIEEIRREVEKSQIENLRNKIRERQFHLHGSHRNRLLQKILVKFRKRLVLETSLILKPVLDSQQEINLRFLKEIEKLKEAVFPDQAQPSPEGQDLKGRESPGGTQK